MSGKNSIFASVKSIACHLLNNAVATVAIVFALCACKQSILDRPLDGECGSFEEYYVDRYRGLTELKVGGYNPQDSSLHIYYIAFDIEDQAAERKRWGDVDGYFLHGSATPFISALSHAFDKITIISDSDFNGIPPGEDLGSKVMIITGTAVPIIEQKKDDGVYSFWPVEKRLDELTTADLSLLECGWVGFKFLELPVLPIHHIRLTYYEGDKEWSLSTKIVF